MGCDRLDAAEPLEPVEIEILSKSARSGNADLSNGILVLDTIEARGEVFLQPPLGDILNFDGEAITFILVDQITVFFEAFLVEGRFLLCKSGCSRPHDDMRPPHQIVHGSLIGFERKRCFPRTLSKLDWAFRKMPLRH
ncbi:hypothetical protein GFL91_03670 [Rhizobium leguminosarum bv. viciae]|uniref:Uncharacterized protein n=1 Tax=Rhizobium leguminosarum bv. viciae TaxID=387 RepID=A0A8I2GPW6_RHILV|nr:hypothetical protein [Rhizobium leguminosarum]NKM44107.1 hypothetical protein [Rhizobium leguminosarum bv. viciae]